MSSQQKASRIRAKTVRAEARVQRYLDIMHAYMDDYERENPHWRMQAFLWLLESGLTIVRQGIESEKSELSWDQSIVTFEYPVDWDWRAGKRSDCLKIDYGQIRSEDSKAKTIKNLSKIVVETIIQTTLQEMTHRVAWEKRGLRMDRFMPLELVDAIEQVRGVRNRNELVKELYRPFSVGVTDFTIDECHQLKGGRKLQRKDQEELRAAHSRMVPPLTAEVNVNGNILTLSLVFQAQPLVLDVFRRKAYYPITTGFVLTPKAGPKENLLALMEEPWAQPARWNGKDQQDFWTHLIGSLRQEGQKLAPAKPSPPQEAVLTINAKLKVPVGHTDETQARALARLMEQFEQTGQLMEIQHSWSGDTLAKTDFSDLLRQLHAARTSTNKGKTLEQLVAALFASVPGFTVTPNQRTTTEEIDLAVINSSEETRWRNSGPLILVECKNWSDRCGKNEIVVFRDKVASRYGQSKLGFLVSWRGFAATVRMDELRHSQGNILIVTLDGKQIEEACRTGEFLPVLQAAWDQAVKN